jgi:hypothetical protein
VTLVTQFYPKLRFCGSGRERVPTGACYYGVHMVLGMYAWFHVCAPLDRIYARTFFILPDVLKFNRPVNLREQGMVSTQAHVIAGLYFGAPLSYNYRACGDQFTIVSFYTKSLA